MEEKKNSLRIGIDFGGVLSQSGADYENGQGDVAHMNMPGGILALKQLKKDGHYLVLVSFCGKSRAQSTRRQLPLHDYFDEVYFVKDRKYKNDICKARALDILIDDRRDILDSLEFSKGIQFGTKPTREDRMRAEKWLDVLKIVNQFESLNLKMDDMIDIYKIIHK